MGVIINNDIEHDVRSGLIIPLGFTYVLWENCEKIFAILVLGENRLWGLQDIDGNVILPCKYATFNSDDSNQGVILMGECVVEVGYNDGDVLVQGATFDDYMLNNDCMVKWGVYDFKGNRLTELQYEELIFEDTVEDWIEYYTGD
ncbi:hypothetical protein G9F72_019265 [Clostridium estertheticum]|uniref:hypothetical protein n=1 Tax=Clostridium estertheticum TaxID=238834 RepID=UPI0013E96C66|nr:hypothetical protein [Clostridium estertheticum]MBZ9688473.1 hypothetical protein [Clostridium estertheticum]